LPVGNDDLALAASAGIDFRLVTLHVRHRVDRSWAYDRLRGRG
jgi:hypothetical protein